ncbi:MAG: efflux RND transporter periplasmic adaptor subunit [Verrucomicrobia bacterium]|nr:MAG: efflux RND transporter periplasmic adaptor subunit [Verrucomicrobiota bacterium]
MRQMRNGWTREMKRNLKIMVSRAGGLLLGVGSMMLATGCGGGSAAAKPEEAPKLVTVVPVVQRQFEDRVEVSGAIEARNTALVTPRLPGVIEELYVEEGDPVKAGETRLFAIDRVKLEKAVEVARQGLAVARLSRLERQANLERAQAVLDKARIDYERRKRLFEEEQIGTKDEVEQLESAFIQAQAGVKHAQALVDLAEEQERQAEANLAIAEKDLQDAVVAAPIDGVVSQRFQDVGDMGQPGRPVLRIDDLQELEASAFLPARHYDRVQPGKTRMEIRIEGRLVGAFPVSYKSPTIDPALRVFEVKCRVPAGQAVPGQLAEVRLVLDRREGLGVPREALTRLEDRQGVYTVQDGVARLIAVEAGAENDGWVEVRSEALRPGVPVITEGRFLVSDGARVEVRSQGS